MTGHENDHYSLSITRQGLIHLDVSGECVMDRGALHEFLDLSERVEDDGTGDQQREAHHHIQTFSYNSPHEAPPAEVKREDGVILISGVLHSQGGATDGMRYRTEVCCDDSPIINISVERTYLRDFKRVVDDSICFLSPGGFASKFHVWSEDGDYMVMDDDDLTRWHPLDPLPPLGAPAMTEIPRRLKASISTSGYGAIMGENVGFGLILDYSRIGVTKCPPDGPGELRAHRPRPPAAHKFDELEFQWFADGPRYEGTREEASFQIVPCVGGFDELITQWGLMTK